MKIKTVNRVTSLGLLTCVIVCGACSTETTESENIATPGIYARMNVDTLSTGSSKVTVELNVGGLNGTNISLSANERLEASNAGTTKIMNRDTDFLDVDYEIGFDTYDVSSPFRVALFRSSGEVIDGSFVFLPPDFDISSPQTDQIFSIDDRLPIMWTANDPGQVIDLFVATRCTNNTGGTAASSQRFELPDDGFEDFDLSQLNAATDNTIDRTQTCLLDVTIERARTGTLDPEFTSGGSISSRQARSVEDLVLRFP